MKPLHTKPKCIAGFCLSDEIPVVRTSADILSPLYIKIPGYVLIAIALWGIINSYLGRRYAEYVVTNKRVIFKLGLIRRSVVELQLNKAEAIAFGESFWGRIFNFGTVVVTTGGATNTYPYIADPLSFRRAISEEVDKRFGRGNE